MSKIAVVYVDASVDTEKKLSGLAVLGLIQQKGGGKFHATLSVPADDSTLAEALAVKVALELVLIALGPRAKVTIVSDHQSVVEQLCQKSPQPSLGLGRGAEGHCPSAGPDRGEFQA